MGRPLIIINGNDFPKFCDNRCINTKCSKHLSKLAGHSDGARISKLRDTPDCEGHMRESRRCKKKCEKQ